MSKIISILLICVVLFGMISCTTDNEGITTSDLEQTSSPQDQTTEGGETSEGDSSTTQSPIVESPFGIDLSDLSEMMLPIFSGNTVKNETVMFLDKGETKTLLFPIENVISVTSYDGTIVYQEGIDYSVVDGKLKVLEKSSIPCITTAKYYNCPGSALHTKYRGEEVATYWGEDLMDDWQINVSYTHTESWKGFEQDCQADIFENFINKLQNGEDVTVIFFGDSITNGLNASWRGNYAPYQHPYPMLFVEALADLFDYTVHYERVDNKLSGTPKVPDKDYVAGTRGTITYINTAVSGLNTKKGADRAEASVSLFAKLYGCDLLVLAFGMNDGTNAPSYTSDNLKTIVDGALKIAPETSVALITTMVSNPADTRRSATAKANQRSAVKELANNYVNDGVPCGVADMGSVSLSVLERKAFHDYSGNNINHPNDFFGRVYAQTLLQTVIGYENMGQ